MKLYEEITFVTGPFYRRKSSLNGFFYYEVISSLRHSNVVQIRVWCKKLWQSKFEMSYASTTKSYLRDKCTRTSLIPEIISDFNIVEVRYDGEDPYR